MAINKLTYRPPTAATPETWMDVTDDTVTSSTMLYGTQATGADGEKVAGSISSKTSSDLTVSGATVTVPAGYYASQASKSVASGTAGTPTATKGAVSNHAISVTPSVTNTTGYITGGTVSGSSVTVSASELVSGTLTVTENGIKNVANYENIDVQVFSPLDDFYLSDIDNSELGGGGSSGLVYETGTWTPASDIARGEISFANTHTEAPILIALSDVTAPSGSVQNDNIAFVYFDPYKVFGEGYPRTATTTYYGLAYYTYRSSSNLTNGATNMQRNSDYEEDISTNQPRYWAKETKFYPYTSSTSRYWRSGRTYKWIAVWKPTT